MSLETLFHYILFALALASIVICASVVWRVEKKLDVAAKLLLTANIFFAFGIFLDLLETFGVLPGWDWGKLVKALFLAFFTLGMYEMRQLVIDLERTEGRK